MTTPLLAFYGDDLTGSTDVMESLAMRGIETVLFTDVPTDAQLARFAGAAAIGLAGTSRSETPDWMDRNLPDAFRWLAARGAAITHYKVCSTFDSSPGVGSIGRAAEIGRAVFGERPVPLLVGAPQLGRWTAFGTLFARFRGETFRIDRHPVMSRHPVTPMREADLRLHLAGQTSLDVALLDQLALCSPDADARLDAILAADPGLVLVDVLNGETQEAAGRQLERLAEAGCRFTVGSSGVEYALTAHWARTGRIGAPAAFAPLPAAGRISVVSGSCSPTTERQIRHAGANGFETIALDPRALVAGDTAATEAVSARAEAALHAGRSVVVHTAMGPDSDLGAALSDTAGARHAIGRGLGRLQAGLVRRLGLGRAVIAGGDTSSHALRQLAVHALTTRLPLPDTPGSPVALAHSDDPAFDGLEIALKGGQVGDDDYFSRVRDGG
ncbi:four-carbon acid sugar kinase family protein [Aureimonas flava]|uniref:Four-carbon acid sugar kinase family protein n=1 Tax=Aureimonas flava TaxID=2320271 RepID=A0A3A1WHM2_9HYPH|nr:four-carbon acid sugar kinase family protein [Aureimonas flava]RIX97571.1 four-carbon acid sugar kinase family protein [Aureimonas flava]